MAYKYHQGVYSLRNPQKYEGDPKRVIFRSSWEKKMFNWCDNNPRVIRWSSEEVIIPYISPIDNRPHRYFVDFKLVLQTKDGSEKTFLAEVKPDSQTRPPVIKPGRNKQTVINEVKTWGVNSAKWEAAKKYCAIRGWEFVILTEKHLFA